MYLGGVYDTWAPGGGDVRIIDNPTLNPVVIFGYVLKSPWGGDGWIVSVNNLEDIIGGQIWIGLTCIVGGFWHHLPRQILGWDSLGPTNFRFESSSIFRLGRLP